MPLRPRESIDDLDTQAEALEQGESEPDLFDPFAGGFVPVVDPSFVPKSQTSDFRRRDPGMVAFGTSADVTGYRSLPPEDEKEDRTLLYVGGALLLAAGIAYAVSR